VNGSIRAKVLRHRSVKIEYYDINEEKVIKDFSGFAAHIIQHECDHLNGIVYLQKVLNQCTEKQKQDLLDLIDNEINFRKLNDVDINLLEIKSPILVFDIEKNDLDRVIIDFQKLQEIFKELSNLTLLGIKEFL